MFDITAVQLANLEAHNNRIASMKSDKELLDIEQERIDKILRKRKEMLSIPSEPFEKRIYLNHIDWKFNKKWVEEETLTEDMIDAEIAFWFRQKTTDIEF